MTGLNCFSGHSVGSSVWPPWKGDHTEQSLSGNGENTFHLSTKRAYEAKTFSKLGEFEVVFWM